MTTFASLFTGGGGADVGAAQAGYRHLWGVEYESKIASVAELNGFSTMVADVCTVDFTAMAAPYWLHMSPPCTRASQANANATESPLDQALADACIRAIRMLRPRRISLENAWGYRNFQAFRSILAALTSEGYATDFWHLNAADYGVPQTRKRLMLCASLDHQPRQPLPTHEKNPDPFNMLALPPWRGWYAAIEDLIPTLPDSQFAKWQLERLPAELKESMIFTNNAFEGLITAVPAGQPWATVVLPKSTGSWRAFLVDSKNAGQQWGKLYREAGEPALTIVTDGKPSHMPRAFVVDCQESGSASGLTNRQAGQPMYTLSATMEPKRPARAFIVNDQFSHDGAGIGLRDADEPALTTTTRPASKIKAYVGRVVKMTPRALARFNGLADSYRLPDSPTLACTVLGNMVPPGLLRPLIEANR